MIALDGVDFTVQTPSECTADMVARVNKYCSDNNIVNSKGETVFINENFASPIYLLFWAAGYLVSVLQRLVYSLGTNMSIQSSTNNQLLELADIAGLKRGQPSVTTFGVKVQAYKESDDQYDDTVNDGKCVITSDDIITYGGIVFAPALYPKIVLQPGEIGYIMFVATEDTTMEIAEGMIQGFDSSVANLALFEQYAAVPGQEEESIAALRERLQKRTISSSSIDAAIDAIRALPGVTTCNIFVNPSLTNTQYIGEDSIQVGAREALVIVQGYNENIAQTFYEHLCCVSAGTGEGDLDPIPASRLLQKQVYISHANQEIPLYIATPSQVDAHIRIYAARDMDNAVQDSLKNAVTNLARTLTMGSELTSAAVMEAISDFAAYSIQGVMVSRDGSTYSYKVTLAVDGVWRFNVSNIFIITPGNN